MAKKRTNLKANKAPTPARTPRKLNEAKETKNFMVALAIGTLLLVIFLFFILSR